MSCVIGLPVLPVAVLARTPIPAMNVVAADQVGWPAYVEQVAGVWDEVDDPSAVLFTSNYGEAGALDRFGPALGLPAAYSGQNALGLLPAPPETAETVVVVGWAVRSVERAFGSCRLATRLDNGVDLDNEEQGAPVSVCTDRREPWTTLWPRLRHLD